jgi:hypothetical protein
MASSKCRHKILKISGWWEKEQTPTGSILGAGEQCRNVYAPIYVCVKEEMGLFTVLSENSTC